MNIRCQCGNDVNVQFDDRELAWLDREWYNEERRAIECPKCKEATLPLPMELVEAPEEGPVRISVDAFRTVRLTRKRF